MSKKHPVFSPYKQQKRIQQPYRLLPTKCSDVLEWDFVHLIDVTWLSEDYTPIMVLSLHRGSRSLRSFTANQ